MAGKFTKAVSKQAFLKIALYGKAGSGKTLTSLLWGEGLAAHENKRVAMIDTERGSEFYSMAIPERTCHPLAFDFDRLITRSIMETIEAVESVDPKEHGVLVLDSVTHLWEAARDAYTGKKMSNGGIPIHAWQAIKKPYKRLMALLIDGDFHVIICGREGIVMEDDEDGEPRVVGTKMKAEGETPHEPHILGRMVTDRDAEGGYIIQAFFEKDRSGILTGKTHTWPNYKTIEPVVRYLSGETQGKMGTPEEVAEKDAAAQEREKDRADADRQQTFQMIRNAILQAASVDQLKNAWELTKGKKGKLGDELYEQLTLAKDTRKAEIVKEVA